MSEAAIKWVLNMLYELPGGMRLREGGAQAEPSAPRTAATAILSDETLMVRVGKGDRHAYGLLVERHLARSNGLATRILSNAAEAEEVVQEAFLRLWKHAPNWQPKGAKFTTWFYRVILNLCIDIQRKRKDKMVPIEDIADPASSDPSADESFYRGQISHRVGKALDGLPERQKAALALCYFQGLSNREAAEILEVNIKALESLLSRGRKALKETLGDLRQEMLGEAS